MQKVFNLFTSALGVMVLSLAGSIVISVCHHWFYRSLDGQPPSTKNYQLWGDKKGLPGQQLNLALGSLFAFMFKALVGTAASTSRLQSTWRAIKSDPMKISTMDSLYRNNVFSLANPKLWKSYPFPMLLALIYWYVFAHSIDQVGKS
jgi:hypothetical protein